MTLIALVLCSVTLQKGFAQESPSAGEVKLYRYGELLRAHGVELKEPSLVNALKNRDASVRYLAAMQLAEDKAVDAIPAIEQALAVEKESRARVNIALALALLGDKAGNTELDAICSNKTFVPEFRLYAVRYMFDLHSAKDENCLNAAEQIIESQNASIGDRTSALELIARFQGLTSDELRRV